MTLYGDQVEFIQELANLRHRGNFSAAIQEIIDANMRQSPDDLGSGDEPYTLHPLAADSLRLKKSARPATSPGTTAP